MTRPEQSVYPEQIDSLVFFQDASLETHSELAPYYNYINMNNFDGAKQYMADSNLDFYGAWFLNRIENCLYAVELNVEDIVGDKPEIVVYSATEPKSKMVLGECFNWVGDM